MRRRWYRRSARPCEAARKAAGPSERPQGWKCPCPRTQQASPKAIEGRQGSYLEQLRGLNKHYRESEKARARDPFLARPQARRRGGVRVSNSKGDLDRLGLCDYLHASLHVAHSFSLARQRRV